MSFNLAKIYYLNEKCKKKNEIPRLTARNDNKQIIIEARHEGACKSTETIKPRLID